MVKKLEKISKNPDFINYYNEETLDKIGRQLDIQEAHKDGRTSGFEDGHASGLIEAAKKMLDKKMKIEDIIDITGLSKEEIRKLKVE